MTQEKIDRINALAKKAKSPEGLTPEEAVKDIADLPLHSGAEKYYTEIGVL